MDVVSIIRLGVQVELIIAGFVFAVGGCLYLHSRHHPAIRARRPFWAFGGATVLLSAISIFSYDILTHYPSCARILFSNFFFAMLTLDMYIARSWILLHNWNTAKALNEESAGSNWWIKNRHLSRDAYLVKAVGVALLLHVLCWMAVVVSNGWNHSFNESATVYTCTSPILWLCGVWGPLVLQLSLILYLSYHLRLLVDAFKIKIELIRAAGVWIVFVMPFFASLVFFPSIEREIWPTYLYVLHMVFNENISNYLNAATIFVSGNLARKSNFLHFSFRSIIESGNETQFFEAFLSDVMISLSFLINLCGLFNLYMILIRPLQIIEEERKQFSMVSQEKTCSFL